MYLKSNIAMFSAFVFFSCAEMKPEGDSVTFLITANVRGQLDPCG